MPEIILHYIWLKNLAAAYPQYTTEGKRVEILDVGKHNLDAGPDFRDVRLRIWNKQDTQYIDLAGNVEIHVHASDWYLHHHQVDPAYDRIIMHVVCDADKMVFNSQGEAVEQMALNIPDKQDWVARYLKDANQMDEALMTHPCGRELLKEPKKLSQTWKQTMLMRRLDCKAQSINRLLQVTQNNWRQAFYISLAHYFGFHTNGIPFEMLAQATPLAALGKHRNNLFQLEAMLLGQSGLIDENDEHWQEYSFLQHKFDLTPISAAMWKKARMRPQNAPVTRIKQFARLIHESESLFSKIISIQNIDELRQLFAVAGLGKSSVDILLINVAVPFKYANQQQSQAIELLRNIPPENNRIIRQWKALKQQVNNAADSQALIHLYQTCCESGKCLDCEVYYALPALNA